MSDPSVIGTSVPEQLISVVFENLRTLDPTINFLIGRRATDDNSLPHSIVAVPMGANEIDDKGLKPGGGPWGSDAGYKGRQLMIRHFGIEWRCHDGPTVPGLIPDFTNVESLYLNLLVQIRLAVDPSGTPFHNGIAIAEEEWLDQQEGADSYARSGTVIKCKTIFDLPVYDPPPTLVPITGGFHTTVSELDQTVTFNEGAS